MLGTSREYLNAILAKKVAMPRLRRKLFVSTLVTKKLCDVRDYPSCSNHIVVVLKLISL